MVFLLGPSKSFVFFNIFNTLWAVPGQKKVVDINCTSHRLCFCLLLPATQRVTLHHLYHSLVKHCGCQWAHQIVGGHPSVYCYCSVPCRWHNWRKLPFTVLVTVMAGLLLSCGFTACFLHISRYNYPGGHAFSTLHSLINSSLDNSLSQTCKQSILAIYSVALNKFQFHV